MIRMVSYNVNGIRAAFQKGFVDWLKDAAPDILCIQETKALKDQVDHTLLSDLGYSQYWFSAEKRGYSGVLILSRIVPDRVEYGMQMPPYDSEGRLIRFDFGDLTLVNVYVPSGTQGGIRQEFKMKFLGDFQQYMNLLKKERPQLIVTGDFNIHGSPGNIPGAHKGGRGRILDIYYLDIRGVVGHIGVVPVNLD